MNQHTDFLLLYLGLVVLAGVYLVGVVWLLGWLRPWEMM